MKTTDGLTIKELELLVAQREKKYIACCNERDEKNRKRREAYQNNKDKINEKRRDTYHIKKLFNNILRT